MMNRWTILIALLAVTAIIATGCSGGDGNPVTPAGNPELTQELTAESNPTEQSRTHLWGYWDVYIDIENQTVEAVPNRKVMFAANVVKFLNDDPVALQFSLNGTTHGPDYIDVDLDVSITHPFPGLPHYNGYDVRGVFMGDGSATMMYNTDLVYPAKGTDQFMFTNPDPASGGNGGPDGYTRWFNLTEFADPSMPMFGYTQGNLATPDFAGTSTLCPYRYFADGLDTNDDLWIWLNAHADQYGQFSSGATNTGNYYLRFPNADGVEFGYAVLADWAGPDPEHHPSNAPEAVGCKIVDNSNVYYVDPTSNGGNLILDISLFGWEHQPSKIWIESTVLTTVPEFEAGMIAIGGGEHYSTYHVEIPADNVTSTEGNEFWVIAEYDGFDYTNDYGVPNLAGTDPLAAFFRYDLNVKNDPPPWIEVLTPNGGEEWIVGTPEEITWISNNLTGTITILYSKDNFISDINFIATDEANDGSYMWENIPDDPSDTVRVRISSTDDPSIYDVSDADFSIVDSGWAYGWARTWGGTGSDSGTGTVVDASGNVYVVGGFTGVVDFDPGPGTDYHSSDIYTDAYLSKFDSNGVLVWTRTWGGDNSASSDGVAVDDSGNVYVSGRFGAGWGGGIPVDFDPGPGTDYHQAVDHDDAFLSKFDSDGDFQWARTWGGTGVEYTDGVGVDGSGNIYVTVGTCFNVDFDPGPGEDWINPGSWRAFSLSKFKPNGDYEWARTWGGGFSWHNSPTGFAVDDSGNAYVVGHFYGNFDFDPGPGTDYHAPVGEFDACLSKFNSNGDFQWAHTWGGSGKDSCNGVAVDDSGNVYAAGGFQNIVDLDPDPDPGSVDEHTSIGASDVSLTKFNSSGDFQWARTWGGIDGDGANDVTVNDSGNIFVTGGFRDIVNFDPGGGDPHTSNGGTDVSLSKFDSSGTFNWARTWGGSVNDYGRGVAADGSEYVYVTGYYASTVVNFAPSESPCNEDPDEHTSNGDYDVFLTKHLLPDGCW